MIDVVLVGIKGYGARYLEEYMHRAHAGKVRIVGVVNRSAPEGQALQDLQTLGVPYYQTLEDFYDERNADLVNISSPIQFHREQTCLALQQGSHVLCEKPIAATIDEVLQMIEYRNHYTRNVIIGYQWAFSNAIQKLKKDILAGKFGKPLRLKTIVLWPRDEDYYARGWAGKKRDDSGRWVLDSVAANATAHFLQNMFYVLGDTIDQSALPTSVVAETYKANRIENFDTAAIRAYTQGGTEILFLASHAITKADEYGPVFEYEFEDAVVRFSDRRNPPQEGIKQGVIQAVYRGGTVTEYGSPFENLFAKIDVALHAVQHEDAIVPCGLETASAQTLCIHAVQQSVSNAPAFPDNIIRFDQKDRIVWVDGLADVLHQCYAERKLPYELGVPWSHRGKQVDLQDNALYRKILLN